MQETQAATINEVIGRNLHRLRKSEKLTLAQTAETLTWLGQPFSEAKLSRWEAGKYRFTIEDLQLLSQAYGVSLLGLLKPAENDATTHIQVGDSLYPFERYVYDFFVDPRGSITDRARDVATRRKEGTRDIVDALNDVEDHILERGRIADMYSGVQQVRGVFGAVDRAAKQMKEVERALKQAATAIGTTDDPMKRAARKQHEGEDDGIDPETR